jgi:hypothetical protein
MRRWAMAVAIGIVALEALPGAVENPSGRARNYADGVGRAWVQNAIERAMEDLSRPACRNVFADFIDAHGSPLDRKLEKLGVTPEDYVAAWLWFMDGSRQPQCRTRDIAAFTETGSRVVYVCASRALANHLPAGDIVIIHEMLHSLGLGENPPSAKEITERVHARCAW